MTRKKKKPKRKRKPRKARSPRRQDVELSELEAILERAKVSPLNDGDREKLKAAIETLAFITNELERKNTSIKRLRQLLFGASTEKTSQVFSEASGGGAADGSDAKGKKKDQKKRKGHGRNGASAYTGAERKQVPHGELKSGDRCPDCERGKVYLLEDPATLLRVKGMAPLSALVVELERYRCNLCGKIFTAEAPEGIGTEKYDETAAGMIGLLKYGAGVPFNRLERLQSGLGIPLPASTQWDVVSRAAGLLAPARDEMIRQAAQGKVLHNDDTTMKILELEKLRREDAMSDEKSGERTGVFTSGIVSVSKGYRVALFFTGRKHAGENLEAVLKQRAAELSAPIQMSDALSRNTSGDFKTIMANCISHARRQFVDVANNFPDEVRHVLEELRTVYENDAIAREQEMSPTARLRFHKAESGPVMRELKKWMQAQIKERKVEPNSGLGDAIGYMLDHWQTLTLFLRKAGAPLDNNICERALKKAILHRKNAYFYKTENGARVGDIFMSLIHTAELNGANTFDYLVALQRHADAVASNPGEWMPWNFTAALARLTSGADPPR